MNLTPHLQINERITLVRPLKKGGMGVVWVGVTVPPTTLMTPRRRRGWR